MTSRGYCVVVLSVIVVVINVNLQLSDSHPSRRQVRDLSAVRNSRRHRLRQETPELDQLPVSTGDVFLRMYGKLQDERNN